MSNEVYDFNIGHSTAYAYAKASGDLPEGMTPEEYGELLASYATVGQTAVTAAQTATTKASEAATSATTATNKASEATTAATTATNKAAEAQADADAAALDASQAMSAASTATTKATEATTAAATATSAKTDAVAANTAAQSAKTAAQTAQTGAETAAASVQSSAAQIQTNAGDISELKEELSEFLSDGNLFSFDSCSYNTALNINTGATQESAGVITSDYIYIGDVNTLYFSESPSRIVTYDASKNLFNAANNPSSPYSTLNHGEKATYARISVTVANAQNFIVSKSSMLVDKYGYYPTIGISGVDVTKDICEYINNNTIHKEELFKNYNALWVSCAGNYSNKFALGTEKSVYAINNISTAIDLRLTSSLSINLIGVYRMTLVIYIPDSSKITSLTFSMLENDWSRTVTDFVDGWNTLVFNTFEGSTTTWSTITKLRIYASGTVGISLYFAKCTFERSEKANLILVEDGGYSTFLENAYPLLKSIGVPVTWALNPGRLGTSAGLAGHVLTQAEIDSIRADYCAEFSFHSWKADPTSAMDADELREDACKCVNYLRTNGLAPEHIWRAAHTQNLAPYYQAEIGIVEALATGNAKTGFETFPFIDPNNVSRTSIHSRSNQWFDSQLDVMKKTHCTAVWYTHGVSTAETDISSESLAYLVDALSDALDEGWLNATTYNRLKNVHDNKPT